MSSKELCNHCFEFNVHICISTRIREEEETNKRPKSDLPGEMFSPAPVPALHNSN